MCSPFRTTLADAPDPDARGAGSGYFDTVETDYDAAGNVSHRSLPFATTNFGQPNPSEYGTSIQCDALADRQR